MSGVKDRDMGYKDFVQGFADLDGYGVTVGVHAEAGGELAVIAAAHEFGTDTIPQRSFLRSTLDEQQAAYVAESKKILIAVLGGRQSAPQALERLGLRVVRDVQATIRRGVDPPLAPATIAKKGSSKQLIDTGRLRQSITHRVVKGG